MLQNWFIKYNDINNNGKIQNFIRSTKTNSPTSESGATSLPPIGFSFMHIETSFSQHLKVSVGNDTYNLTKYNKIQITDTTIIQFPNVGGYLLHNWFMKYNDINNNGKIQNFIRSTKTNSPTSESGATSLPPIGFSFMHIDTSFSNHGNNVFCSFERTDFIQITNISFYYIRFSILTNDNLKAMGRFRNQLLLPSNTWSTQYTIAKNTQYSDNPTDWTLLNLDFTVENCGIN